MGTLASLGAGSGFVPAPSSFSFSVKMEMDVDEDEVRIEQGVVQNCAFKKKSIWLLILTCFVETKHLHKWLGFFSLYC